VTVEQIVGRERRERVSQLGWCGGGCFDSRRRVNSDVMPNELEDDMATIRFGSNTFSANQDFTIAGVDDSGNLLLVVSELLRKSH